MGVRRQAREAAMQALFMCDFLGAWNAECVQLCLDHFSAPEAARPFTEKLCSGVLAHKTKLDAEITCASENWSLSRMGRVDRAILRVATYEILLLDEIPINVAINEAIEVAKRFGAEESPQFVNGVLDRVASTVRSASKDTNRDAEPSVPPLEMFVERGASKHSEEHSVETLATENVSLSELGGKLE